MKNKKAYTLVELSIVLVIISMIFGLIFFGVNIKQHAQLNNVYTQLNQITSAMEQFETTYGSLPGDLALTSRLPTTNANSAVGNGNGMIDSGEVLQFWLHLSMAGLYTGNFIPTAAYQYIPAVGNTAGGFPAGPMLDSGFTVSNDTALGTKFNFSSFISTTTDYVTSVVMPGDGYYIDNKYDDGLSTSGIVRSSEGTGITAGNCQSSGVYNQTVTTPSCYMSFYVNPKISAQSVDTGNSCTGTPQGTQRVNTDGVCGYGTYGSVVSTCNPDGSGNWVITKYLCEPNKCTTNSSVSANTDSSFSTLVSSQYTMACPANTVADLSLGFGANGINCTAQGTFSRDSASSNATQCQLYNITTSKATAADNANCLNGYTINIGCPITTIAATNTITCNSTTSYNTTQSCAPMTCTSGGHTYYIGQAASPTISTVCNATYYDINTVATAVANGNSHLSTYGGTETCILPLTKGSSTGVIRLTDSFCTIKTGVTCATNGTTRSFNCPFAYSGTVTQTCTGGYWLTTTYGCQKLTCGGSPIGSFRIAEGVKCTGSGLGSVVEVCDYCDTTNYNCAMWYRSYANCI